MRIGVPGEIKPLEGRVGLVTAACSGLVAAGHSVAIESGAGVRSGYTDESYQTAGAEIVPGAADLYRKSEIIVKVKEPVDADLAHLRKDHILFSYLHLAANAELTAALCDIGLTAVAFEPCRLKPVSYRCSHP